MILAQFGLSEKVAVVTGGTGHRYGSEITEALAEAGARVIATSRTPQKWADRQDDLQQRGLDVEIVKLDLESKEDIVRLRDRIHADVGHVDILVNNAAARAGSGFDEMSAEEWAEPLDVNATGLFLCCKSFGMPMARRGSGSIINIASIYGMVGPDFGIYPSKQMKSPANYTFAKGGMIAFTRYLATYLSPQGVRVNTITPGGLRENQPPEFVEAYEDRTPMGRMAEKGDLGGAVVFLASDAAGYITGQNLPVDGGWTSW